MNSDSSSITARLQAATVRIDSHLYILRHSAGLHAAIGNAQREPACAAGYGLPLQSQRSLVANSNGIGHPLPWRELAEIEMRRVHIQLRLPGGHWRADANMHRNLRVTPI